MQRNIGLDPFIGTKKGTVERGTEEDGFYEADMTYSASEELD